MSSSDLAKRLSDEETVLQFPSTLQNKHDYVTPHELSSMSGGAPSTEKKKVTDSSFWVL